MALSTVAGAADLRLSKGPVLKGPAPVVTDWNGFYVGANWGVGMGASDWSDPTGKLLVTPRLPSSGRSLGLFGGLTAGWNYQSGPWVGGLEADIDVANLNGNSVCGGFLGLGGVGWNCTTKAQMLGSVALRGGYAFGRALAYLKGGAAFQQSKFGISSSIFGAILNPQTQISSTRNSFGWTLGAGIEYDLGNNWSAKAEYDYYGFPKTTISGFDPNYGISYGASVSTSTQVFKFGLNYRFGGAGGVASPAPVLISDVSGEFGGRLGWTSDDFKFDLFDPFVTTQQNSRLTWPNQQGVSMETFARLEHASGIFAKGFIGGSLLLPGHMHDEDFPPAAVPYSNTVSSTKNSSDFYGTIDLGYDVLRGAGWKLGAFVGYNYYEQRLNAYGCAQVATNPAICATPGVISPASLGLSRNEYWQSMRLGIGGQTMITDRLKLELEAAWLPYTKFTGNDNHWFRPDINPLTDSGVGHTGYQLEGIGSYQVTKDWSVGLGARYWSMSAKGHTTFPGFPPSPTKYTASKTTVFLQAAYKFGAGS